MSQQQEEQKQQLKIGFGVSRNQLGCYNYLQAVMLYSVNEEVLFLNTIAKPYEMP